MGIIMKITIVAQCYVLKELLEKLGVEVLLALCLILYLSAATGYLKCSQYLGTI
jgi:hypothetical protein